MRLGHILSSADRRLIANPAGPDQTGHFENQTVTVWLHYTVLAVCCMQSERPALTSAFERFFLGFARLSFC